MSFGKESGGFSNGLCSAFGFNLSGDVKKNTVIFNFGNNGREDAVDFKRLSFFIRGCHNFIFFGG